MATAGIVMGIIALIGFIISIILPSPLAETTGRPGGAARKASGCSRWAAWPAPGTVANVALRADGTGHAAPRAANCSSLLAGQHEHGHRQRGELIPQRLPACRCRPGGGWWPGRSTVLRRRSSRSAASAGSAANSGCASQRSRNASTPSRSSSVAPAPRRRAGGRPAPPASSIPAVAPSSTRRVDQVGPGQREVQRQPAAHRVADVGGPAAGGAEQRRARRSGRPHCRRAAVAGRVDEHDLVVAARSAAIGAPRAPGLGEAVDEHDARGPAPCRSTWRAVTPARTPAASSSATASQDPKERRPGPARPGTDHRPSKT